MMKQCHWLTTFGAMVSFVIVLARAAKLPAATLDWMTRLKIVASISSHEQDEADSNSHLYTINSPVENENVPVLILFCQADNVKTPYCDHVHWWIAEYYKRDRHVDDAKYRFMQTAELTLADHFQDQTPFYSFPALLYSVYGTVHLFDGDLSNESMVIDWYARLNTRSNVVSVNESNFDAEIGDNFGGGGVDAPCNSSKSLFIVYVSPRESCRLSWIGHLSVALKRHNVTVYAVAINAIDDIHSSEMELNLLHRFGRLRGIDTDTSVSTVTIHLKDEEQCRFVFVVQGNKYKELVLDEAAVTPTAVRDFAVAADACLGAEDGGWHNMSERLTDIEITYLQGEDQIDKIKRNPSYVIISATGGIGVIALATSIFWGLNSSSFAKQ